MPILNVKISADRSSENTNAINDLLLDLTSRILKKKREVTSIAIEYVNPGDWSIGGVALKEQGKTTFYFDIKITDETNTKDEKAKYIQESFEGFKKIFGNLHETSYIHIEDVRAAAYGFGGLTQEYRNHH